VGRRSFPTIRIGLRQLPLAEVGRQVGGGTGLGHPRMRLIGELGDLQQVIAAEGRRSLPRLAVLVAALERDVEDHALPGAIGPDGGLDPPEADLLDGTGGLRGVLEYWTWCVLLLVRSSLPLIGRDDAMLHVPAPNRTGVLRGYRGGTGGLGRIAPVSKSKGTPRQLGIAQCPAKYPSSRNEQ